MSWPGSLRLQQLRSPLSPDEESQEARDERVRQAADASVLLVPVQGDLQVVSSSAHDETRQARLRTSHSP